MYFLRVAVSLSVISSMILRFHSDPVFECGHIFLRVILCR